MSTTDPTATADPTSTAAPTTTTDLIATSDARTGSRIARQVAQFHHSFSLPLRISPTAQIGDDQAELRLALIEEEVGELRVAAAGGDLTGIADALADIVYVAFGSAHVYGIDLDAVLDEVHSSNMTKLGADGRAIRRADGKVLKGPAYRAPDVAAVLAATASRTDAGRTTRYGSPSDILDT